MCRKTNIEVEQEIAKKNEEIQFDKVSSQGRTEGLFKSCMNSIRSAHFQANRLRAAIVIGGLFTDVTIYREVITLFYIVTKAMEEKLIKLAKEGNDEICTKILELGYMFHPQYEQDLEHLYGKNNNWREFVEVCEKRHVEVQRYKEKINNMMTGKEVAGACFVLWGALIIGGGAAAMPRVQKLCNGSKEACHIFENVTGPGRSERREKFIRVWDSLVPSGAAQDYNIIVKISSECMQHNNDIISSVKRNPWWYKYGIVTCIGIFSAIAGYALLPKAKNLIRA